MATATTQTSGSSDEQLIAVLELVKGADSVEPKLRVQPVVESEACPEKASRGLH